MSLLVNTLEKETRGDESAIILITVIKVIQGYWQIYCVVFGFIITNL